MNNPLLIAVLDTSLLRRELVRRLLAQQRGKCSQCGRPLASLPYCGTPSQHAPTGAEDLRLNLWPLSDAQLLTKIRAWVEGDTLDAAAIGDAVTNLLHP